MMRAGCWPTAQRDQRLSMLGTSIFSSNSHFVLSQQQLLSLLSLSSSWKVVPGKLTDWAAEEPQPTEGRMWLKLCSDPMASLRKPICWLLLFVCFSFLVFAWGFSESPSPLALSTFSPLMRICKLSYQDHWNRSEGPTGILAHYS